MRVRLQTTRTFRSTCASAGAGCTFAVTLYVIGVNSWCDSHHQSAPGGCEEAS